MKIKCPVCENWNIYDDITEEQLYDRLFLCNHCKHYISVNREGAEVESI